jgi:EmrB/QacA subfamily drug resistance transporter
MNKQTNKWVLVSLSLSTLMGSLGISIANVTLPTLTEAFVTTFQSVQWIVISYLLTITVTIVSIGKIGDVFGLRRVLMIGVLLYTIASLFCGIAPKLWVLILARGFQGLGAAILIALSLAYVKESVSKKRIGAAMGLLGTMSAIGTASGPTLGGVLIEIFSWRAIFLILIPLGIVNLILIKKHIPIRNINVQFNIKKIDWIGTFFLALTLACYTLAMTIENEFFNRGITLLLLLTAVIGSCLFLYSQTKVQAPLIQLKLFKDRNLNSSLIINAFVSNIMMATLVIGPFYLSLGLGLGEILVGIVLSIGPIISIISGIPSGKIVDGFGTRKIITIGLLLMTLGAFALSILPNKYGVVGYIIAIAILTPGYQLFQASNNTLVMMNANDNQRGIISGILNLSRNLGLITGASVMGALFAYAVGKSDFEMAEVNDISKGMNITFIIAGILMLIALLISLTKKQEN